MRRVGGIGGVLDLAAKPEARHDRGMTSASTPTRGMPIALSRRANDNSAGWSQVLSLALDGITARHYLSWIRDPDPPALGRDLRAVAIDAAPVSDRIELRLVWDREPPDAETAAAIAGFPIGPEVATLTSAPRSQDRREDQPRDRRSR